VIVSIQKFVVVREVRGFYPRLESNQPNRASFFSRRQANAFSGKKRGMSLNSELLMRLQQFYF
jgi:hypothetical protein